MNNKADVFIKCFNPYRKKFTKKYYSKLYESLSNSLGFQSKLNQFFWNSTTGHTYITIYNETVYCNLDQLTNPNCFAMLDISKLEELQNGGN